MEHIETAEDIASETFLLAVETWAYKAVPANPTAWLYFVAKNKARNYIKHNNILAKKILREVQYSTAFKEEIEIDLSEENITDSQLQMLFAICHPAIPVQAQVALALRILGGFGIDEIAVAFLANESTIKKRLFRAKATLRSENVQIQLPPRAEIGKRLDAVLTTLYLLFSEGYYSEIQNAVIRKELCLEAMRLTYLLIQNEHTNLHATNALLALMCYHASRLDARTSENDEMILYQDQNEDLWNTELIEKGNYYLQQASTGTYISKYFLEASIAYWHTIKTDTKEKWENILQLYDHLLGLAYSPVVALNRTFALFKARGKEIALLEAEELQLQDNHFYHLLIGELWKHVDSSKAKVHLRLAYDLAKKQTEKQLIKKKIDAL